MFLQLLAALSLLKVALAAFCDQTLVSPTGTVSSPSFSTSSSYANNLNCQYDIKVSLGFGIKLSWSTFDIKGDMPNCDDDFVEIYIGCGRYSVGKYCSEYGYMPFDVYSPDNCLRIKFHSNSSVAGKGFQGYYSSINRLTVDSGVGASCRSSSENFPKTFSATSGVFSSPEWPSDYPDFRDCYWRIDVAAGKNVKVAVMDLNLEFDYGCDDDKLKIKGGRSGDSYDRSKTIKDSMCGEKNPFYFTSPDRRIWIRFKSNSFRSERGFVVGYVKYDARTVPGSTATSIIGIVVGILIPIVIIACICYVCVYKRKQARQAQQHQHAHVVEAPQEMTVQHPPPHPQQGYAPPSQAGYGPPPQQGYAPPPQPGYGPPPQQGYGPPQQPGYPIQAPPPYSQVAGAPYPPPQDKSGQPSVVSPYPGAASPYPPGQPGVMPPYPPAQAGGVPPYPPEQPPYPSAPSTATAPPYPP